MVVVLPAGRGGDKLVLEFGFHPVVVGVHDMIHWYNLRIYV